MVFSSLVAVAAFLAPGHPPPPDSLALHREARSAQERFERTRVRHSPISWWSGSGPCDERVGRFCLRFGRESEEEEEDRPSWIPPPDAPEVKAARDDLIATLDDVAGRIPGDGWVAGQRVAYLAEVGRWEEAWSAATACRAEDVWCRGLQGIALHGLGRTVEAGQAFQVLLDSLDPEERDEWRDPGVLGGSDWRRHLVQMEGSDRTLEEERIWRLSDPLFLLEGNPLWTEHLSRRVLAMTRETARNGHAMRWGRDMTELLVRYGPVVAYERTREPLSYVGPPLVVGRYDPVPRNLLPSFDAMVDPAQSEARDWLTHQRRTISRHAPALARRIHAMDAQITRFEEGDSLLVRVDWALTEPPGSLEGSAYSPIDGQGEGDVDGSLDHAPPFPPDSLLAHLFLVDVETLEYFDVESHFQDGVTQGTAVIQVPPGRYLLSMEGMDPEARRAWRHRVGVERGEAHRGLITLSDLLLLEPLASASADMEVPVPDLELTRALPSLTVPAGQVEVLWEVYGLGGSEAELHFQLKVEREGRGLLRRLGEAVGLLGGQDPLEVGWSEGVPREEVAGRAPLRRSMVVDLSSLDPGEYELILSATPPGRTTVTTGRRIQVSEGGVLSR